MNRKMIADKLYELYNKEGQVYANPIQTRPEPSPGITGQKPEEDDLSLNYAPQPADEKEITKDLGLKGSEKDLGKSSEKDLGRKKESEPKNWEFKGPRDWVKKEI